MDYTYINTTGYKLNVFTAVVDSVASLIADGEKWDGSVTGLSVYEAVKLPSDVADYVREAAARTAKIIPETKYFVLWKDNEDLPTTVMAVCPPNIDNKIELFAVNKSSDGYDFLYDYLLESNDSAPTTVEEAEEMLTDMPYYDTGTMISVGEKIEELFDMIDFDMLDIYSVHIKFVIREMFRMLNKQEEK